MTAYAPILDTRRLALAIAVAMMSGSVLAQHVDHSTMDHGAMHQPAAQALESAREDSDRPSMPPAATEPASAGADHAAHGHPETNGGPAAHNEAADHAGMDHSMHISGSVEEAAHEDHVPEPAGMDHSGMDHSGMDHSGMDHSGMDHSGMDHSGMDHSNMVHPSVDHPKMDHSRTDRSESDAHCSMGHAGSMDHSSHASACAGPAAPSLQPLEPIPPITDADRRAAFPELAPHPAHGESIHSYFLANRLEAWDADSGTGMAWEAQAWIGKDTRRVWIRSEGERSGGETEAADVELLYGRSISPWWEAVAGVRHDWKPGDGQSHLAIGVMGLAPQWFEIQATAYLSEHGRLSARIEAEYELLLTNRLILQPLVEASFHGGSDPARGLGTGLGTVEAGLRLRYEVTRQFAPYIGLVRERAFGETAEFRRGSGEATDDTHVVAGLRIWF